ncbi:MAG: NADH:ubiquinone oxidoreductase subunit N, partial [Betaproteobacteria bacterium]|nr:NADH:ubiquinone oxidoreductase subunit N [Betaproteobacteria bacterium]
MEYIMPLWPAYPELFLLAMACVVLIVDLFISDDNRVVTYGLTQFTLAGCALLTFFTGNAEPVYTFSGMFVDDLMADALKLATCVAVIVMLVYARAYNAARGVVGA